MTGAAPAPPTPPGPPKPPSGPKPQPTPKPPSEPKAEGEGDAEWRRQDLLRKLESALTEIEETEADDFRPDWIAAASPIQAPSAPSWLANVIHAAVKLLGPWLVDALHRLLDSISGRRTSDVPDPAPPEGQP